MLNHSLKICFQLCLFSWVSEGTALRLISVLFGGSKARTCSQNFTQVTRSVLFLIPEKARLCNSRSEARVGGGVVGVYQERVEQKNLCWSPVDALAGCALTSDFGQCHQDITEK